MAYSIYFYLKPAALEVLDRKQHPILSAVFEPEFRRQPDDAGELFGYIKPENRPFPALYEIQLFKELTSLHQQQLIISLSHDEWESQPSLAKKLTNYPELLAYIDKD